MITTGWNSSSGGAPRWVGVLLGVPLITFACKHAFVKPASGLDTIVLCFYVVGLATLVAARGGPVSSWHATMVMASIIAMFYSLAPEAAYIAFNLIGTALSLVLFWLFYTRPAAAPQNTSQPRAL